MKYTIALLCPYFGSIDKSIHSLWLQSCGTNPAFSFLLITDDIDALNMPAPSNVKVIFMSWEECKSLVRSKMNFEITLNNPYKLCDFKPAYGSIFSDYLQNYDFWGHLDCSDTILGSLDSFITDERLDEYDKIHSFGHFTLYRNTPEVNSRFVIPPSCGTTIQELFARPEVTGFDEMNHPWSINTIYKENGFLLLERIPDLVADLLPAHRAFRIVEDNSAIIPRVFEWYYGKLFDVTVINNQLHKREIGYVHFQKRKMKSEVPEGANHFYMIPNCFISADEPLRCDQIIEWSKKRLYLAPFVGRIQRIINYAKQPTVLLRKIKEKVI